CHRPHPKSVAWGRATPRSSLRWTTAMVKSTLIADDNALIRQGLRELFRREVEFEVCREAKNGREAIEEAQELRPDLILLDLSMPVMNGLDAARGPHTVDA